MNLLVLPASILSLFLVLIYIGTYCLLERNWKNSQHEHPASKVLGNEIGLSQLHHAEGHHGAEERQMPLPSARP